ncbi:MAG TPA: transcriptional regulator [Methylomirabilota bacterium]|nr:transcriptional regulator [Methylomirabilota bacterium]
MKKSKERRLEAAGWTVGSAKEFLGLSEEEAAFVELKLVLADHLKRRRVQRGLTQTGLARTSGQGQPARIHSSRATTAAAGGHPTGSCSAADLVTGLVSEALELMGSRGGGA